MLGRAEADLGKIVAFQDIEHLQRRDALAVGRQFPHVIATVIGADRLDPFALVAGQILIAQKAAIGLEVGTNGARDLALIERVAPAIGDLLQGIGQVRVLPQFALARGMPVEGELLLEAGVLRQPRHGAVPVIGDRFGNRVSLTRVADRRRQVLRHRLAAKTPVQREPAVHRARHRHRQRPGRRNVLQPPALELGQGERLRRAARPVVAVELVGLGVPHDREQIPAHPVAGRLHQAQCGIGSDRRIHRRTAVLHHIQRDLRGQRLRGRGHGMRGDHFRAGGERLPGDAVGRTRRWREQRQSRHQQGRYATHGKSPQEHINDELPTIPVHQRATSKPPQPIAEVAQLVTPVAATHRASLRFQR